MNAKIELQNLINEKISNSKDDTEILKLKDLWYLVEKSIFDVPSDEEIENEHNSFYERGWTGGFKQGCNFILNYSK